MRHVNTLLRHGLWLCFGLMISCDGDKPGGKIEAICGDAKITVPEICDGNELNGEDCTSQNFTSGVLACLSDCSGYDTSACTGVTTSLNTCGNGVLDAGETCDGTYLNSQTCETQLFAGGVLGCNALCSGFDTSGCLAVTSTEACGNNTIDTGELCDGSAVINASCEDYAQAAGTLKCTANCTIDIAECGIPAGCGDGVVAGNEDCEPTVDTGLTCEQVGLGDSTAVACSDQCRFDFDVCQTADLCTAQQWYSDGTCDPCELLGGATADPDCEQCAASDGQCISYFGFGVDSCTFSGSPDPDCGACGDGVASVAPDGSEQCDGTDLGGKTCGDTGYASGVLACTENCTYNFSSCVAPECGNGIAEGTEQCDGADVQGYSCTDVPGQGPGDLGCNIDCSINTDNCAAPLACCAPLEGAGCISDTTYTWDDTVQQEIQDCVCALDDFCCSTVWDAVCVQLVEEGNCASCGGAICGDGQVDPGEECEVSDTGDAVLDGKTCSDLGYTGGALGCDATTCTFDVSPCTPETRTGCGDGTISGTEECDGDDLDNKTCISEGFVGGTLVCSSDTCQIDRSQCSRAGPLCGNDAIDTGEQCDGTLLNSKTCATQVGTGFGGTLLCSECGFDVSECIELLTCGDGTVDVTSGEQCDGSALDGQSCTSLGFTAGTLACNSVCQLNVAGCTGEAPPTPQDIGQSCDSDDVCLSGLCFDEVTTGWPDGLCGQDCSLVPCPIGSRCFDVGPYDLCLPACSDNDGCRPGYGCFDATASTDTATEPNYCLPNCKDDSQCPDTQTCNAYTGLCEPLGDLARNGEGCTNDGDCEGQICLTEATENFPGGTCVSVCDGEGLCPGDGICRTIPGTNWDLTGYCFDGCTSNADCRENYSCISGSCYPGAPAGCGNNSVDLGEICDGVALGDLNCASFGRSASGSLSCASTCDGYDLSACIVTGCANDGFSANEICDGASFSGPWGSNLCADWGLGVGAVSCTSGCTPDFSACSTNDLCEARGWYTNFRCDPCELLGGQADPECFVHCANDGVCADYFSREASGWTCALATYARDPDCQALCGDGLIDGSEDCDPGRAADNSVTPAVTAIASSMGLLAGRTCQSYGLVSIDQIDCTDVCEEDLSGCARCTTDADCAGHPHGTMCETASGSCVECAEDTDCNTDLSCVRNTCVPNAGVGSACSVASDCVGNICFQGEYIDGYCSQDASAGCPTGSHASVFSDNLSYCFRDCTSDNDCRLPHYGCYDLNVDGTKECAYLGTGPGVPGSACSGTEDCSGGINGFCLAEASDGFLNSGYCTADCTTHPCSIGSLCLNLSGQDVTGQNYCFGDCSADTDCRSGYECLGIFNNGDGVCFPTEDSPCCFAQDVPGCATEPSIEDCVCLDDPYCCDFVWDEFCVATAQDSTVCTAQTLSCATGN
jgi:hypothetical protein